MEFSGLRNYVVSKTLSTLFWRSSSSSMERYQLLDPLSVVIALATNAYKPIGTKLSIVDCKVLLHDPSILQGTIRALQGDTRMNVKLLHYPIIHACRYFAQQCLESNDLVFLLQKAKKGLENLWHTYQHEREVRACINTYINITQSVLDNGKSAIEMLDMLLRLDVAEMSKESSSSHNELIDVRKHMFDELFKTWDKNKICTIVGLLRELDTAVPTIVQHMFAAIDAFMQAMHTVIKQVIDSIYEQNQKPW